MEYTFANGSGQQQERWREAISHLLSFPAEALPNAIKVEFVDPSSIPGGHTSLAATTWSYGSPNASTLVRNDAPGFGDQRATLEALAASMGIPFSIEKFYMETAAHELGHALFASLPEGSRVAIAQLFGAGSDDIGELTAGSVWQDQIIEGIAETFKEAFLPRRYRVFPNRTNRSIPYHKFAEFRSLFRDGVPEIAGGEVGEGETPTEALFLDILKQGGIKTADDFLPGAGGLWTTGMFHDIGGTGEAHDSSLTSLALFEGWVREGTVLSYEFIVPASLFIYPPYLLPSESLHTDHNSGLTWTFRRLRKAPAGPEFGTPFYDFASWQKTANKAGEAFVLNPRTSLEEEGEQLDGYALFDGAKGLAPPSLYAPAPITVGPVNFPGSSTRICQGDTYRFVSLLVTQTIQLTELVDFSTHAALRAAILYPWLPAILLTQSACPSGGGQVIVPGKPELLPGGSASGAQPHKRPIVGNTQ